MLNPYDKPLIIRIGITLYTFEVSFFAVVIPACLESDSRKIEIQIPDALRLRE